MKRRDAPDNSSRLTSFCVEGRGSRLLPQSNWPVHCSCRQSAFAVDNLTVDSRVDREMFSGSVDAGIILVLPFYRLGLEPDCVRVSTRGSLCAG